MSSEVVDIPNVENTREGIQSSVHDKKTEYIFMLC